MKKVLFGLAALVMMSVIGFSGCEMLGLNDDDDTTAPVLSGGNVSAQTANTATLQFTSSEEGVYYYLVLPASDQSPNAAAVKAQIQAAAKGAGSAIAGLNNITANGLTANVQYTAYIVVSDAAGNDSSVLTISGVNPVSGGGEGGDGKFVLSGLTAYVGNYIYGLGVLASSSYYACSSLQLAEQTINLGVIGEDGTAKLKVYFLDSANNYAVTEYTGSDTISMSFMVYAADPLPMGSTAAPLKSFATVSVTFTDGAATQELDGSGGTPGGGEEGGDSMETAASLTEGVWTDTASISVDEVVWYTFQAEAGKGYAVQGNDRYGDGTYSDNGAFLSVTAYQSDGTTTLFDSASYGYTTPKTISGYSGTVYIKVECYYSNTGNYAIRFYTADQGTASAASLTEGTWTTGASIDIKAGVDWYRFEADAGKTYKVQLNDQSGDGTYSESNGGAALLVAAYQSDGTTTLVSRTSNSYSQPKTISGYSGWVYIKVEGYGYSTGGYAIRYYTTDQGAASAVSLEEDAWTTGASLSVADEVDWYTFQAEAGKAYKVQWNDRGNGDGTYSSSGASLRVTAYQSDETTKLFNNASDGYTYPQTISGYEGTVYIKVEGYYSSTGGYAIRYYTTDRGRGSATSLSDRGWTDGASISIADEADWYSFPALPGKTYKVQWNDLNDGDGTYSSSNGGAALLVTAYQSDGTTTLFDRTSSNGYTNPKTISGYGGMVYIKVQGGGDNFPTGNYAIRYYTTDQGTASAVSLSGAWTTSASISIEGEVKWYSFVAFAKNTYKVQWNDANQGDGTYSSDNGGAALLVTAYQSDGATTLFDRTSSNGYTNPKTISGYSGWVYIKVESNNNNATGTYAIRSYTADQGTASANSISDSTWRTGVLISDPGAVNWYKFEADAEKTYKVQWNDAYQGDGTYSSSNGGAEISVTAYRSDGTTTLFDSASYGYTTPKTISGYGGTVYLKVEGAGNSTGNCAIRYYEEVSVITYSAEQSGGSAGTANSTGIRLTFSVSVGLSSGEVSVTGAASASGQQSGYEGGAFWIIPITVNAEGTAYITITRNGVDNSTHSVTVYKAAGSSGGDGGPTDPTKYYATYTLGTWTAGGTGTTLTLSADSISGGASISNVTTSGGHTISGDTQVQWDYVYAGGTKIGVVLHYSTPLRMVWLGKSIVSSPTNTEALEIFGITDISDMVDTYQYSGMKTGN